MIVPTEYSAPFVVEFDKPLSTGNNEQIIFVISNKAFYYTYYDIANGRHCKFQVNTDGTIYVWVDGIRKSPNAIYGTDSTSIRFQIQGNQNIIQFKNFMIYEV